MEQENKLKIYYRIIDYGNAMWEHDEETAGDILAGLEWKLKYAPDTEDERLNNMKKYIETFKCCED